MESRRSGGITPARVPASGARGSATAKETCWESGSRFGLDGLVRSIVVRLYAHRVRMEPEFNPPHLISEYQLGHLGWLMSHAFFCLGAASLALFAAAQKATGPSRFGTWGLMIIGVAYFCAGIFPLRRGPIAS